MPWPSKIAIDFGGGAGAGDGDNIYSAFQQVETKFNAIVDTGLASSATTIAGTDTTQPVHSAGVAAAIADAVDRGALVVGLATAVASRNIPAVAQRIATLGYSAVGHGAATYERWPAATPGGLVSADGACWRIADRVIDLHMVGGVSGAASATTAMQTAINVQLSRGGGVIRIPRGTWNFPAADPTLNAGAGNLMFVGDGPSVSIVNFDEGTAAINSGLEKYWMRSRDTPASLGLSTPYKGDLHFEGIEFVGTLTEANGQSGGNLTQLEYFGRVSIHRCRVRNLRRMGVEMLRCGSAIATYCEFRDCARDAFRPRDTPNVVCAKNLFERIGDDSIAVHTADPNTAAGWPLRDRIVIVDNLLRNTCSIKVLGGRRVIIARNICELMNTNAIEVANTSNGVEGGVPLLDIQIVDNQISDIATITGAVATAGVYAIVLRAPAERAGAAPYDVVPGAYDADRATIDDPAIFGYTLPTVAANPISPVPGVVIARNKIGRTRGATAAWSDYGHGKAIWQGSYYDPAVTEGLFRAAAGIGAATSMPMSGAQIVDNLISHVSTGITFPAPASDYAYSGVVIARNTVRDATSRGITVGSSAKRRIGMRICDNTIIGDPYRRAPKSTISGGYTDASTPNGIDLGSNVGALVERNVFSMVSVAIQSNYASELVIRDNALECQPAALGYSAANRGVGLIPYDIMAAGWRLLLADCDPTSATYRAPQTQMVVSASAQPSAGWYPRGWQVLNTAPSLDGSSMTVTGWVRLTTGSGHVAGTDWSVMRASHVSPAT